MSSAVNSLPKHLKKYIFKQAYETYSSNDHSVWRYILKQNFQFFARESRAVPMYLEGLDKSGISFEYIPKISDIDNHMEKFGWGAVPVLGFIPPIAFLQFQAHGVLPIASSIRQQSHIGYTPAPDIVHEAAGHAPILFDPAFSHYIKRIASIGSKAIFSKRDIRLYEAIRFLSDLKENPDTTLSALQNAENNLKTIIMENDTVVSEAAQIIRLYWWTAEYGLMGRDSNPKIYGAGLLSSVKESHKCLSDSVLKIPHSIESIDYKYDITEPQPQLFCAKDFDHLHNVLDEVEARMSFKIGGNEGLMKAKEGAQVSTVVLDSDISISGILKDYSFSDDGMLSYIEFSGKSQISYAGKKIEPFGGNRLTNGICFPVGAWQDPSINDPSQILESELSRNGIKIGDSLNLKYKSGYRVEGIIHDLKVFDSRLSILIFKNFSVFRGSTKIEVPLYTKMAVPVGSAVVSVYGGAADECSYGPYTVGEYHSTPKSEKDFDPSEMDQFIIYQEIREIRELDKIKERQRCIRKLQKLSKDIKKYYPKNWLLALEMLELCMGRFKVNPEKEMWLREIKDILVNNIDTFDDDTQLMIKDGLRLIGFYF